MFENLRAAFREALKNFQEELHRDEVPETVDRLVGAMKREAAEARMRLDELESALARARAEEAREAREVETCRRREAMARRIGDEDTARLAAEFAERHERRQAVLQQKAEALAQELSLHRADVEEMIGKIREAERSRAGLAASAGRTQARESVRAGDQLMDELDRMAEQMTGGAGQRDEGDRILDELEADFEAEDFDRQVRSDPGADLDARLAELKRRMGRD